LQDEIKDRNMDAIVQHYIGTTAEWMAANPLLYDAVWAIEVEPSGRRLLKIGDGERRWQALPYFDASYIKGLPERLAAAEAHAASLQETLAQEITARTQGDLKEESLRMKGDDDLLTWANAQIQEERTARISLQQLVGQLEEYVREQLGPYNPIELITDDGFEIVTQDGKSIVTDLDLETLV
jgi:hypothetical protein